MLVATRDHEPGAGASHFAVTPPRSMFSRFTSGVQLLGSLVGIPLALIGGYSTYHANFSPEATCQSLRSNIIAMLDKKADASTLRMLVHRDVAAFERDCGAFDAEAAAAFKTLLAAERTPPRRAEARAKAEPAAAEPAKVEAARSVAVKSEAPKKIEAAAPVAIKADREKAAQAAKPAETVIARRDSDAVDVNWVASVREALRESASRPIAVEPADAVAAPMPAPLMVPDQPGVTREAAAPAASAPVIRKADHPIPPAPIPNADVNGQSSIN